MSEDMVNVDAHPDAHRATEPDEEAVLKDLYGPPDDDGVYRWTGEGGGGFDASGLAERVRARVEGEG